MFISILKISRLYDNSQKNVSQLHFYNYDLAGPGLVSAASSFQHQEAYAVRDLARQLCGLVYVAHIMFDRSYKFNEVLYLPTG